MVDKLKDEIRSEILKATAIPADIAKDILKQKPNSADMIVLLNKSKSNKLY